MAWKQNLIYSQPTDKTGEDETFLLHLGCHCSACQTKSEGTTLPLSLTPCLPKKIMHCFNGIQSTARIKVIDVMSTVPQNSLFSITAAFNSSSIACFFRFICNQYEASLQRASGASICRLKFMRGEAFFHQTAGPNCVFFLDTQRKTGQQWWAREKNELRKDSPSRSMAKRFSPLAPIQANFPLSKQA